LKKTGFDELVDFTSRGGDEERKGPPRGREGGVARLSREILHGSLCVQVVV
jgi:hypothetical protein